MSAISAFPPFAVPPLREFVHLVSVASMFGLLGTHALFSPIQARHLGPGRFDALQEKWILPRMLQLSFIAGLGAVFTFVRPFLPAHGMGSVNPIVWLQQLPMPVLVGITALGFAVGAVAINLLVFEPMAAHAFVAMHKRRQEVSSERAERAGISADAKPSEESSAEAATLVHRFWHALVVISNFTALGAIVFHMSIVARVSPLPSPTH
jgi:hypothetical protein